MTRVQRLHPSPFGDLRLVSDGRALAGLYFPDHRHPAAEHEAGDDDVLDAVARWLDGYFAGRDEPTTFAVAPTGTPFQMRVWEELRRIPRGSTATYGEIARRIGEPTAVRAVGAANGRNPVSIVIPCHRVTGAGGVLTGYAGGLGAKRRLLDLEGGLFGVEESG